jgi:hypothetical protein
MQGGAVLGGDGVHACNGVKGFSWEDNGGAVGEDGEDTEGEAETVEKWRWTAECIRGGELHAVADEP